jgi:hypothetical protein
MGYGDKQMKELEETINAADCDAVIIGTPIDLGRMLTSTSRTRACSTSSRSRSPRSARPSPDAVRSRDHTLIHGRCRRRNLPTAPPDSRPRQIVR